MTNVFQPNVFQPNVFQVGTLDVVIPGVVTKHHKWLSIGVTGASAGVGVPTVPAVDHGRLYSYDATYALAREGTGGGVQADAALPYLLLMFGQNAPAYGGAPYYCFESVAAFDLSVFSDTDVAAASFWFAQQSGPFGYTVEMEIRAAAYSSPIVAADFVPGSQLGSHVLYSSLSTDEPLIVRPGLEWMGARWRQFVGTADLIAAIAGGGTLKCMFCSADHRTGTPPSGAFNTNALFPEGTDAGTAYEPFIEGGTAPADKRPAFFVSRDSKGILLAVRDNAAPQFAVGRDSDGLTISVSR